MPGRDLRDKVQLALAWKRVALEVADRALGGEFDRDDRADLQELGLTDNLRVR